jgi:hypothetical protein
MTRTAAAVVLVIGAFVVPSSAQQERPLSPPGTAATMVGGEWVKDNSGASVYQGGKWIEVSYSRPMLRQRTNIFGAGADYGVAIRAGAPLWRAGANQTTVLKTDVALAIGGRTVPAGEYGLLIDLRSPSEWNLVLTSQPRQTQFDANNKTDLMGAANYDAKFDVARVPMQVNSKAAPKLDQFTIFFADVTRTGGKLAFAWENTVATVEFAVR